MLIFDGIFYIKNNFSRELTKKKNYSIIKKKNYLFIDLLITDFLYFLI